jgi:hypothetical protein
MNLRKKRYEDGPIDFEIYIPFLRYPSFEQLSTDCDIPDVPGMPRAINTLTPSTVECYWCCQPPHKMEALLNACSRLTRFEFVVPSHGRHRSQSDTGYEPLIGPQDLLTMLLKVHGSTLKMINLDYQHPYDLHNPELRAELLEDGVNITDNDFTYDSFLGFENLLSLSIEFEKLVHVRRLPPSLKSLHLTHCRFADLDEEYLNALLRLKGTWCPLIESVTVTGLESTNEGITMVLEHARSLDAPVQVSEDGRSLSFFGAACYLKIYSREALPYEERTYEDWENESE